MVGVDALYEIYESGVPIPTLQILATEICSLVLDKNLCAGFVNNYIVRYYFNNYIYKAFNKYYGNRHATEIDTNFLFDSRYLNIFLLMMLMTGVYFADYL